jgi:superfamily II DNA helicase RecQ
MVIIFMQARIQRARHAAGGKVVIYANTVRQAQAMAEVFGCEAYHSQQVDRAGVLEWFIQGITDVVTATNALGMGVDILDIRVIFHMGVPWTLLDYAQESGRAGWDREASEAIIIQPRGMEGGHPDTMDRREGEDNKEEEEEAQLVQRYMAGGGCRRVVLDEYLDRMVDGYQRQRCGDAGAEEQACDQCNPSWQAEEEEEEEEEAAASMTSGLQAVRILKQPPPPRRVRNRDRGRHPAAPEPEQPTTPPATQPALGLGLGEDGPGPDASPASSGIVSQIRYEPQEQAAVTPPP